MAELLARHDRLLTGAVEAARGRVAKHTGDGILAVFGSAADAVSAAVDGQLALAREDWGGEALHVRMGVHSGEAVETGGDYFGSSLNRAARVMSAGWGGQVLCTSATVELARNRVGEGIGFRSLGEHRLRDLSQPLVVWQVTHPRLADRFPPLRSLEGAVGNVPTVLSSFIGRRREVQQLGARLADARLLTLTGPGGVGKTRLSITVADNVSAHFSGGVAFVGLAHIRDASLVASAIAQSLGVRASGAESVKDSLTAALGIGKTLLLLDNFEQVVDAAPLALDLLAACPQLTIMVTSRTPLRLRGEVVIPVSPLDLPAAARSESPEAISRHASVRLFVARSRAVEADFALDEVTAPTVSEICWRLDGLPLAIELAAARIRMLPPTTLLARLEKRLPLLTGGARDAPDRQRTLRDTIAWSHDLLRPHEQTLFRRLAVFTGGWTLEAAEAVVGVSDVEVLDGLETLLHQSVIQRVAGVAGEPRYDMLETVHEYARERLTTSGEAKRLYRDHAAYFLAFANDVVSGIQNPDQNIRLDRLEAERANFRGALAFLAETGDHKTRMQLAAALWALWFYRGPLHEGVDCLDAALKAGRNVQMSTRAAAHCLATLLNWTIGEIEPAIDHGKMAVALAREADAHDPLAWSLYHYALVLAWERQEWDIAIPLTEEAVALARAVGPERTGALEQFALGDLGTMVALRGDPERGVALIEEALAQHQALGHHYGAGIRMAELALIDQLAGRGAVAAARYAESLRLLERCGDAMNVVLPMAGLVGLASQVGQVTEAARVVGMLEAIRTRIGVGSRHGPPAVWCPFREQGECRAREVLGARAFAAAFEAGRQLPLAEALREAIALADAMASGSTAHPAPRPGARFAAS
jgi:predicted ATPase